MTAKSVQQERITNVDALRGFALFGILVVNITAFSSPYYGLGVADPAFAAPLDQAVRFIVAFLFETKFYLLFSFLFGYSFTLQMASAERAGEAFVPRLLRRQAGLWVIGLAHAVLLFHGDILTTYAVLGRCCSCCATSRRRPRFGSPSGWSSSRHWAGQRSAHWRHWIRCRWMQRRCWPKARRQSRPISARRAASSPSTSPNSAMSGW
ncbi:hypothetical protein [Aminobacter sp. MSH1]|uniref:DUF418 domain-containing protein n=1 Tax=Aminobacter sp. MSH1 TaxID=374606 RepID=UPI001FDFFE7E|nr:hypothetical protein [Aminobacter sp. MSH1]